MERKLSEYENWPSVTHWRFASLNSEGWRAVEALLLAISEGKSIRLKPGCRVLMEGLVGVPVPGSEFHTYDVISTSRVQALRLEHCSFESSDDSYIHVVVETLHTQYLAFERSPLMTRRLDELKSSGISLEDYSDLIESIEEPIEVHHTK